MLKQHLKQLTEDLNIPTVQEERHYFQLPINPVLTLSVRELDPGVFFFSELAPFIKKNIDHVLLSIMKANFLGQGTLNTTIALDPKEKFLTLSLAIPYDMNYREFKETAEDFANAIDFWRAEINRLIDLSKKNSLFE